MRETALVIRHGGHVLVERRVAGEWWEGLWDFPRVKPGEARANGHRRLGAVRYTVTHHRIMCRVIERRASRRPATSPTRRLVTLPVLAKLAMTAPGRRIARML
jgi:adenine-specific DNA glycosylase